MHRSPAHLTPPANLEPTPQASLEPAPQPSRRARRSFGARVAIVTVALGLLAGACGRDADLDEATVQAIEDVTTDDARPTGSRTESDLIADDPDSTLTTDDGSVGDGLGDGGEEGREEGGEDRDDGPVVIDDGDMTIGTVENLAAASDAVVQIIATGEFASPGSGTMAGSSSGTGFIVTADGIAITNNHVVTGAAFLEVRVPGETTPRRAEVLGVSECSDLAVVDIDGEGFPSLGLSPEEPRVGVEVFAAGYPLGDPEFTLTDGIISKARADGVTTFSAIDSVLEHSATINPGNSGGPLLSDDGEVLAVNYAGNAETEQYFAIAALDALPIIEELRLGNDVDSVGLSGEILNVAGVDGLFVESVATGSPADTAGIRPGDVITEIEGVPVAAEGTMRIYCETLRNNAPGDQVAVEVYRPGTGEILAGNLNGPTPLATTFASQEMGDLTDGGEPVGEFTSLTDTTGRLTVDAPSSWSDVRDGTLDDGNPFLVASTSADDYLSGYNVPGMIFALRASADGDPSALLSQWAVDDRRNCTSQGIESYDDGLFEGLQEITTGCPGANASTVWVAAVSKTNPNVSVVVGIQVITDADADAAGRIIATFNVI